MDLAASTVRCWLAASLALAAIAAGAAEPSGSAARGADASRPVLELLFDGDVTDSSGSQRACTVHGTVAFAAGRRGQCASFDGCSWIDTGVLQAQVGDRFTAECWVNPGPRQSQHADLFGNHVSEGQGFVLQQDGLNTNEFIAAYGAGGGRWVMTEGVPLVAERWQHVALVKTAEDLRFYLNGVLVAAEQDPAPARPSTLPVAVGLGYTDQARCFRGLVDEFRIWNHALTDFGHAGIDPEAARETRALGLDSTPRPASGEAVLAWTLATDDTRISLGVTARGDLTIRELSCPAVGRNWISRPVSVELWPVAVVAGQQQALRWRWVKTLEGDRGGKQLAFLFVCDDPTLEAESHWQASPGPGPIQHRLTIRNRSDRPVRIGEQPTFDLDLAGAAALWSFHSDGITPDPVGVYRQPLATEPPGRRYSVRTVPTGEFIPYVVFEADQPHGVYVGLEWSCCRIETVTLAGEAAPGVRVRAGNRGDLREELAPGQACEIRPGLIGAYRGDLDDAGNRLRRWLAKYRLPEILRQDTGYPKVQWNAFGATGKTPGSWDPVEKKYYPLIDDIAPLGFEEVMIDVAWWDGSEPDSDPVDWAAGMKQAADYAHDKGLRFGLYWTDNLDMANPADRQRRAERITRLFREYHADMWRSDCTRGEVIGASFAATRGFYEMVDTLARQIPNFQWENCSGGGRIKDFGAMSRAVKIFNSDTYSALHVRQAFYDSSYVLPPRQLEGHLGSTDGGFRPRGVAGMKYAFRSMSLGAPEWFLDAPNGGNGSEPWTQEEKDAVQACVATYKARLRPLVREADLYHILPRPDGRRWDGIQYYDPATGKGVVYLFKPSAEPARETIRLKGLDARAMYRLDVEDGTQPPTVKTGQELMESGLVVSLPGTEASELVFFAAER